MEMINKSHRDALNELERTGSEKLIKVEGEKDLILKSFRKL